MTDVSTFRLYVLRAMYLILIVGLGLDIWPLLLSATPHVEHMRAVVWSLLAAVSLLAVVGLRYPLQMLPLLFFELTWKSIWVIAIGLPLWSQNRFTAATRETWFSCLTGLVVFSLAIPWRYVVSNYVRRPGDRWRGLTRHALPQPTTGCGRDIPTPDRRSQSNAFNR